MVKGAQWRYHTGAILEGIESGVNIRCCIVCMYCMLTGDRKESFNYWSISPESQHVDHPSRNGDVILNYPGLPHTLPG